MTMLQPPAPTPADRLQSVIDLLILAKDSVEDGNLHGALVRSSEASEALDGLVREFPTLIIDQSQE